MDTTGSDRFESSESSCFVRLSRTELRLIFEIARLTEYEGSPAQPANENMADAHALAEMGLLAEHESYNGEHERYFSYAVTGSGREAFNLAMTQRE